MNPEFTIYSTAEYLYMSFDQRRPAIWYEDTTCIVDSDEDGCIFGMELLIYEENRINFALIQEQFSSVQQVTTYNDGLVYIMFRSYSGKRVNGFGRRADIGINEDGKLSAIRFAWVSEGAGVPFVDPAKALACVNYINGVPIFEADIGTG